MNNTAPSSTSWLTLPSLHDVMHQACDIARQAADHGDVPVGALILDADGRVIGQARNHREDTGDPLAHAEVLAMREAAQTLGTWNLSDCTLVVTLEPCPMCAGACLQTRIGRIVFGAWDPKLGACGSVWDLPRDPHIGATAEVIGGIDERECTQLLHEFFQRKRSEVSKA